MKKENDIERLPFNIQMFAITTKSPKIKQTVGAQYTCFTTATDPALTYAADVEKSETVKSVSTNENSETSTVKASGKDYVTKTKQSSVEISTEVVAVGPDTLAKMRGETIDTGGLFLSGGNPDRPFFAYGKVVLLDGGVKRFEWFPKCQLTANTDEVSTSEDSFKEQNDTLTIKAMAFDASGNTKVYVQTDSTSFPAGLTEEEFFAKPILTPADLATANPVA